MWVQGLGVRGVRAVTVSVSVPGEHAYKLERINFGDHHLSIRTSRQKKQDSSQHLALVLLTRVYCSAGYRPRCAIYSQACAESSVQAPLSYRSTLYT